MFVSRSKAEQRQSGSRRLAPVRRKSGQVLEDRVQRRLLLEASGSRVRQRRAHLRVAVPPPESGVHVSFSAGGTLHLQHPHYINGTL